MVKPEEVIGFIRCFFSDDDEWNAGLIKFVNIKAFDEELRDEEYERVLAEVFDTGYPIPNVCEVYHAIEMIFIVYKSCLGSTSPVTLQLLCKFVNKAIDKIIEEATK